MTLAGRGLPTVAASAASVWRRLAEGEGFEPPVPFRVQWFSRPPPSTTRPSLPPSQAYNTSLLRRRQPAEKNRHGGHEMQSLEASPRLFRPEYAPICARIL